jgi:NADH:ubiquinone oxidoreductase subunit K
VILESKVLVGRLSALQSAHVAVGFAISSTHGHVFLGADTGIIEGNISGLLRTFTLEYHGQIFSGLLCALKCTHVAVGLAIGTANGHVLHGANAGCSGFKGLLMLAFTVILESKVLVGRFSALQSTHVAVGFAISSTYGHVFLCADARIIEGNISGLLSTFTLEHHGQIFSVLLCALKCTHVAVGLAIGAANGPVVTRAWAWRVAEHINSMAFSLVGKLDCLISLLGALEHALIGVGVAVGATHRAEDLRAHAWRPHGVNNFSTWKPSNKSHGSTTGAVHLAFAAVCNSIGTTYLDAIRHAVTWVLFGLDSQRGRDQKGANKSGGEHFHCA